MRFFSCSKFFFLAFSVCTAFGLPAQVSDHFSDGNFNENPAWQGDAGNFVVTGDFQLRLNAPAEGASILWLPAAVADSNVWEMYFRLDFDPSASNRLRIYLMSDTENLLAGSGYFLSVGEDGSADAIHFYRQDAGSATLLASGEMGSMASTPEGRLRMERQTGGQWTLLADLNGGINFLPQLEVEDATYGSGNYFFGLHCTYTATRRDKFYFDDVLAGPLLPDTSPPQLLSVEIVSATQLDVIFNESLEEMSASDPSNYLINNAIGEPADVTQDGLNPALVHLFLNNALVNLSTYTLTTAGISDLSANASPSQTVAFTFIEVQPVMQFDVLLNEILADPTPPVGLPEVEFVELYNASQKVIDLAGFGFSSGSAPQAFPAFLLLPDAHVLVCDDSDVDSLALFGPVLGLPSFPALSNEADELTLTDAAGNLVHRVKYSLAAYQDAQKADGGWTLELVNPLSPCQGESNWRASSNLLGGTPDQPNSVLNTSPDETGPTLMRVFASAAQPQQVQLFFDENLDKNTAENPANYTVEGIGIASASLQAAGDAVTLTLLAPLQTSVLYTMKALAGLTDCLGNATTGLASIPFALPETIGARDLVLNEILFNPATGGVDFVEIYNRSQQVFNLGDLIIGNLEAGVDTVVTPVQAGHLIFPGEYAVFTENPDDLLTRFTVENPGWLVENDLPSFNDDAGNVTIFRADTVGVVIVDAFNYNEDFHHPLLNETEGVSLERQNPDLPVQDRNNWHSAAASAGFATPTYRNSQFFEGLPVEDDFFDLPNPTFSPDGDGYEDFLLINYALDKPGYAVRVQIFDSAGRPLKSLAKNELLATEGFLRWDGDTDDGQKARIGIYMIWLEVFHPDGEVRGFRKTCVVAGRLD